MNQLNIKNDLELLIAGAILLSLQQETSDPQNFAINRMSADADRIVQASQYLNDIQRICSEVDMVKLFVEELFDNLDNVHKFSIDDQIVYFQGSLLNLIHQLKDKIFRLCDVMVSNGVYKDPKKLKKIKKEFESGKISSIKGLGLVLKKWDQENDGSIGYHLKRRVTHHHFKSKILLDKNLQKFRTAKIFQKDNHAQGQLSEQSISYMEKMKKLGFEEWKKSILTDNEELAKSVKESIYCMSKILYSHFHLGELMDNYVDIINANLAMSSSLKVENTCDYEKLSNEVKNFIMEVRDAFVKIEVKALYFIGDLPRGEKLSNDIILEMVCITSNDDMAQQLHRTFVKTGDKQKKYIIKAIFLSEENFLSDKNKKSRFFCKTDGLLILGGDLIGNEQFPKIGLELAFLLNSDIEYKVKNYKRALAKIENNSKNQKEINFLASDISRTIIEVISTVIIAESAVYEKKLSKVKQLIDENYPQFIHIHNLIYQLATKQKSTGVDSIKKLLSLFAKNGTCFHIIEQVNDAMRTVLARRVNKK